MPVTESNAAPYAPPKAVLAIIDRHRNRGLPPPINGDVLGRSGIVSDSLIPRTLQALQALELIDEEGNPTEVFEGLRRAPEAEFKQRLADWLKSAYAEVFIFVDPATDDETRIRDAFRNYKPIGQQGRMVTLFTGLCTAAGLMPEKSDRSQQPQQSRGSATPRPRPSRAAPTVRNRRTPPASGATDFRSDLPPPLAGLLATLPSADVGWTKAKRDSFVAAFGTVLDFCIPIVETTDETENGGA